jgi:hypothetical protein
MHGTLGDRRRQVGWVALLATLWTAVTYFKANIFTRRPFLKRRLVNIAATDRKHGRSIVSADRYGRNA